MEDIRTTYEHNEQHFREIPEVTAAEEHFKELYEQLRVVAPSLADEFDTAAGELARAYSLMGFIGAAEAKESAA